MDVQTHQRESTTPHASVPDQAGRSYEPTGTTPADLAPAIEAVLLTLERPISALRLAEALDVASGETPGATIIERAIKDLNEQYARNGRSFRIEKVAGGFRVMTLAQFAPVIAAFHASRTQTKLSRAAIETLSVVAYRQPITRADLEAIRGVSCGDVLRSLIERRLVTITGRAEELGRPMLYGTTKSFLDLFGLASTKDLPPVAEFLGS